jgi:carbamoyl-phosphate synthase small subunit
LTGSGSDGGYLILEDGATFAAESLLGDRPALGEAVFNTSHTGYQEIITDPSYFRQLIVFTAPHIGNVGVNAQDVESEHTRAAGVIIKSLSPQSRSWRAEQDFTDWLTGEGIPALVGANTRAITLHLRDRGAMRAGIFDGSIDRAEALEQVKASESMLGADLARQVTRDSRATYEPGSTDRAWHPIGGKGRGLHVAILDFGVKMNIVRELTSRGCTVTVLPAGTAADDILADPFDGLLVSNGPGDPASVSYGIETVRRLLDTPMPMFGICLGHQLLALAAGGRTFKLPFGHRGANHPVRRESDGAIEISSQNHGFAVHPEGLGADWRITHVNLNDRTVEGLRHASRPVFSIQYHPEASPGPHEGHTYFDLFIEEMLRAKA